MGETDGRRVTLEGGGVVDLRPLVRADSEELVRGFQRLSPESRYRRFLDTVERLTPEQVRYLTEVDGASHVAWCAVTPEGHGVAVARSVREGTTDVAEYAITVADDWHRRGVGRVLTSALARAAWDTGVRRWRATLLADNKPVLHLLASVGDELSRHVEERGAVEVLYALRAPGAAR